MQSYLPMSRSVAVRMACLILNLDKCSVLDSGSSNGMLFRVMLSLVHVTVVLPSRVGWIYKFFRLISTIIISKYNILRTPNFNLLLLFQIILFKTKRRQNSKCCKKYLHVLYHVKTITSNVQPNSKCLPST